MNNKATISELIFMVIFLFILGIGFLMARVWTSSIVANITAVPIVNATPGAVEGFSGVAKVQDKFDYIIFGAFIAMVLGMLIAAWFIAGNAIFTFIYFFAVVFIIVLSAIMANVWLEFFNNAMLVGYQTYFPITDNLITYMPYYVAVIGLVSIIIMFAKPRY